MIAKEASVPCSSSAIVTTVKECAAKNDLGDLASHLHCQGVANIQRKHHTSQMAYAVGAILEEDIQDSIELLRLKGYQCQSF